jgi:hypothetical protein
MKKIIGLSFADSRYSILCFHQRQKGCHDTHY